MVKATILVELALIGEIIVGAHKRGLKPKSSEKSGEHPSGKITFPGLIGAGPIRTNSSARHNYGGNAEIGSKGPFLA